jgi:hypothetical protein
MFKLILNQTSLVILLRYCLKMLMCRVCEHCLFTVYYSLHIVSYALHLLSILVLLFQIVYTHVLFLFLYIFLVCCSGELFLVSYVRFAVDCYNSCYLDSDVCYCDVIAAVGRTVLYVVCVCSPFISI